MSKRDCGIHDGSGHCPYCGMAKANDEVRKILAAPPASASEAGEENAVKVDWDQSFRPEPDKNVFRLRQ